MYKKISNIGHIFVICPNLTYRGNMLNLFNFFNIDMDTLTFQDITRRAFHIFPAFQLLFKT